MSDVFLDHVPKAKDILLWIYGEKQAKRRWPERGQIRAHYIDDIETLRSLVEHYYLIEAYSTYRLSIKSLISLPETALDLEIVKKALSGLHELIKFNTDAQFTTSQLCAATQLDEATAKDALVYLQHCDVLIDPRTPDNINEFRILFDNLRQAKTINDLLINYERKETQYREIHNHALSLSEQIKQATVAIHITVKGSWKHNGSGFLIKNSNLVVTANHIINNNPQIAVSFTEEGILKCKKIWGDEKYDIAILRFEQSFINHEGLHIIPKEYLIHQMDSVWFAGYPDAQHYKKDPIVTACTIGAINSSYNNITGLYEFSGAGCHECMSGGPLYHEEANAVIGIGIMRPLKSEAQNIAFATPIGNLNDILPTLNNSNVP